MTVAPVGLRCPDHSGRPQGVKRVTRTTTGRPRLDPGAALVTKALIVVNVIVFLGNLGQGASLSSNAGSLFEEGALFIQRQASDGSIVGLGEGEWWRLITAAFLHASLIHLGMNMLMLWWIGAPMEAALGPVRFLAVYLATGLSGSAGALLFSPNAVTVGASGAIFGILGAALVFERQRTYVLGGSALGIIVLNLIITFTIPNISIGGHIGGLAGGAAAGLALTRFGRTHAAYGRPGLVGVAGLVVVAIVSFAVSYYQVQQYVV
jgi:membrane associated rhomboid family serine protease